MKPRRLYVRGLALCAIALITLIATGCSAATPAAYYPEATQAVMEDYATEAATEAAMFEEVPEAASGDEGLQAQATPGSGDDPLVNALPQDRMIVKNGEISLLVEDTHTAIDLVTQIAVDNGGYVLTSQAAQNSAGVTGATLTIAVRADGFETAMRRLRQIAIEVQRENSSGQDVTSEYVDLKSRLANLEATRDRIAKFLDQAKTVEEALKINKQLADIEGEIEQVRGRMTYLTGRSAFSTITVALEQKVDATPTPTPTPTRTPMPTSPWSLSPTIDDATGTQISLVRALLQLAVWIIVVPGPYLVIAALAFWAFNIWTKRRKPNGPPPPPSKSND